jgi:hypothetical protein
MKLLEDLVRGQRVALVGNAQSLSKQGKAEEIDGHDIVIRMNLGLPGLIEGIGERTDIWATAKWWGGTAPLCRAAVFMKLTELGDRHWEQWSKVGPTFPMVRWPADLEAEVREFVGADPGTGIRMLYWLKRKSDPLTVSVYGMDCWETPSNWSNRMNTPNHKPSLERAALEKLL